MEEVTIYALAPGLKLEEHKQRYLQIQEECKKRQMWRDLISAERMITYIDWQIKANTKLE